MRKKYINARLDFKKRREYARNVEQISKNIVRITFPSAKVLFGLDIIKKKEEK